MTTGRRHGIDSKAFSGGNELPQASEAELPDGVGIAYDGLKLHL